MGPEEETRVVVVGVVVVALTTGGAVLFVENVDGMLALVVELDDGVVGSVL